jgi:cell division transport system ATP-binding protein
MFGPLVDLQNISVVQDGRTILENVQFKVYANELVYLIGKVGTGKTSLIKTLYAELPLMSGSGTVNDFKLEVLNYKNIPYLRRSLGIVFQDFKLLTDRNIHDNLRFVLEATDWKDQSLISQRIKEVLLNVLLSGKEFSKPNELSGGEQQRVVIARALLNEPKLILADEPTGNLDPTSATQIMHILQGLTQNGSSVIIATHQYNLIKQYPGRILKIEDSKLVEIDVEDI